MGLVRRGVRSVSVAGVRGGGALACPTGYETCQDISAHGRFGKNVDVSAEKMDVSAKILI